MLDHTFRLLTVGALALGFALSTQAAPAMFDASFVFHAWGNDVSTGATDPYIANTWVAIPLGYDCQHAEKYSGNILNTRYCSPAIFHKGHPATGMGNGTTTSKVSVVPGTPVPGIVIQQSAFGIHLYTHPLGWPTQTDTNTPHCCRGFNATFPPYLQSWTYATFVNAAGSFFAGGGAAAAGYFAKGTGTTAYNNKTGMTGMTGGTWRIRAGKNAFGGALGMLGRYGARNMWTTMGKPTVYAGTSSWAFVQAVGRLLFNTPIAYDPTGNPTAWQNPFLTTNRWYGTTAYGGLNISSGTAIGTGTLWTTGQVGNLALVGAYATSVWRTGYDNRTPGGLGNIQLVTPTLTHWVAGTWISHTAQLGMLRLQVPEPCAALLLVAGAGALAVLHRVSQRR
jgi:hypothetical protein